MKIKKTITSTAQADIIQRMVKAGLSQRDFATMLGWEFSTLNRKLTGSRGISVIEMLHLQKVLSLCEAEKELTKKQTKPLTK